MLSHIIKKLTTNKLEILITCSCYPATLRQCTRCNVMMIVTVQLPFCCYELCSLSNLFFSICCSFNMRYSYLHVICVDQHTKTQMSSGGRVGKPKEEEQDGMSVHSPCKPPLPLLPLYLRFLSLYLSLKFEFGLELTSSYGDRSNHRLNWSWDCWKLLRFTLQWGYKVIHTHVHIHAHIHTHT